MGVADVLAKLPKELTTAHEHLQLGACLQAFAAPEALFGDNAYLCGECSKSKARRPAGQRTGSAGITESTCPEKGRGRGDQLL